MEQYSRRFIEELANHIDPVIIDYFNKKRNLLNFSAENVAELIDETLMEYLDGKTSREDLVPIINKVKKSRLQKRSRCTNHTLMILIQSALTMPNTL